MKNILKNKWVLGLGAVVLGLTVASCEDEPDKFEATGGVPVIKYIRPATAAAADSLIDAAYLDNLICIVGNNLRSVHEVYFNDQKAILNTSYITDNTLLVAVPGAIPTEVTNKIYLYNKKNQVVDYDFKVMVPAPAVRSISCEWAPVGTEATIYGDYLIDDPNVPIKVTFAGNVELPQENIVSVTKTALKFIVPDNWTEGYMNVTSIYGTSRSAFKFHDTTNILFDWDGTRGGHASGYGWRNGVIHSPGQDDGIEAIDGNYLYFGGTMSGEPGSTWDEDSFSFNYWPDDSGENGPLNQRPEFAKLLTDYGVAGLQIKFECYVPASNPWRSSALQMIFSSSDVVSSSAMSNAYFSDTSVPRGLWNPWQSTGSYDTGGEWVTVSMPLNTFTFTHEGQSCASALVPNGMTGLTFFVWNGGVTGTDCDPVILIDNIRVVPVE